MSENEVALKLNDHDHDIGTLKDRVRNCEQMQESIHSLAMSVQELAINVAQMGKSQADQNERLSLLEQAPADEWKNYKRTIIDCATTGVVGAIIGALLTLIIR